MPGEIVSEIIASLRDALPDAHKIVLEKVIFGLGYTAVKLNTAQTGICFTFQSEISSSCHGLTERAGSLAGCKALEIAELARSWNLLESVLGVATLNALSSSIIGTEDSYSVSYGNVFNKIKFRKGDVVTFVGKIKPLIERVRKKVDKVYVLERDVNRRNAGILPDLAAEEVLPNSNVTIITGTAIANGTIDRLLQLSDRAREVVLVGASASMIPGPLFKHGVTIVGAIRVRDADRLLQIVAEAGGTHELKTAVDFINLRPRIFANPSQGD